MPFRFTALQGLCLDRALLMHKGAMRSFNELKRGIFSDVVDRAVKDKHDALVIAGSLYDEKNLSYESALALRAGFRKLFRANVRVVYAHGRIDPSPLPEALKSSNIYEFTSASTEIITIPLAAGAQNVTFWGCGADGSGSMPERAHSHPVIGVIPAESQSIGEDILGRISACRHTLVLLGGIVQPPLRPPRQAVFASSPTGSFYGQGKSPVLTITVRNDDTFTAEDYMPPGGYLRRMQVDNLRFADSAEDIRNIIVQRITAAQFAADDYIFAELSGPCPAWDKLDARALEEIAGSAGELTGCHIYVDAGNLLPAGAKWECPPGKAGKALEFLLSLRNDDRALTDYINRKGALLRSGRGTVRKLAGLLPGVISGAAAREE